LSLQILIERNQFSNGEFSQRKFHEEENSTERLFNLIHYFGGKFCTMISLQIRLKLFFIFYYEMFGAWTARLSCDIRKPARPIASQVDLCGSAVTIRFQNLRDSTMVTFAPISETDVHCAHPHPF
jgi:hypothetical protein